MTKYDIDNLLHDVLVLDKTWREELSMIPPLDIMPSAQREQLKEFALAIYKLGLQKSMGTHEKFN